MCLPETGDALTMVRAMQKSGEFRGCGAANAAKGVVPETVEVRVADADLGHPGSQEGFPTEASALNETVAAKTGTEAQMQITMAVYGCGSQMQMRRCTDDRLEVIHVRKEELVGHELD